MKYFVLLFGIISSLFVPNSVFAQQVQTSIDGNNPDDLAMRGSIEGKFLIALEGAFDVTAKVYNIPQRGLVKTIPLIENWEYIDLSENYIYTFGTEKNQFQIYSLNTGEVVFDLQGEMLNLHPQKTEMAIRGEPYSLEYSKLHSKYADYDFELPIDEFKKYKELKSEYQSILTIVSLADSQETRIIQTDLHIDAAVYSPDGFFLYVIGTPLTSAENDQRQIVQYEVNTWKILSRKPFGRSGFSYFYDPLAVHQPLFSPDGQYLAIPSRKSDKTQLEVFELGNWTNPNMKLENAGDKAVAFFGRPYSFHANSKYIGVKQDGKKKNLKRDGFNYRFKTHSVGVFELKTGQKLISIPSPNGFQFHPHKDLFLTHNQGKYDVETILTDFRQQKTINTWILDALKYKSIPIFSTDGAHLLMIEGSELGFLDFQERIQPTTNVPEDTTNRPPEGSQEFLSMVYVHPNGKKVFLPKAVYSGDWILDLSNLVQIETVKDGPGGFYIDPSWKYRMRAKYLGDKNKIEVSEIRTNQLLLEVMVPSFKDLTVSPSGKYFLALIFERKRKNYYCSIQVFDIHSGRLVHEIPASLNTSTIQFLSEKEDILVLNVDEGCEISNFEDLPKDHFWKPFRKNTLPLVAPFLVKIPNGEVITCWQFNRDWVGTAWQHIGLKEGKYLAVGEMSDNGLLTVRVVHTKDKEIAPVIIELPKESYYYRFYDLKSDSLHFLVALEKNNLSNKGEQTLYKIHVTTGEKELYARLKGLQLEATVNDISPDGKYLYSIRDNGTLEIWHLLRSEKLLTIYPALNNGYLLLTPDGYYHGTKGALENVRFSTKDQSLPFQQYDLKYNRPDIILSRFDESSSELVALYRKAYEKRIEKMGFDENREVDENHFPEIKVTNASIPPFADQESFEVSIEASDSKYALNRLNIWVNDVPIFGRNGQAINGQQGQSFQSSIEVPLTPGENRFRLSVMNEQGVESLFENFSIEYRAPQAPSNLYLISIGVSEYSNAAMNLNYAAKDAQDISQLFSGQEGTFQQVFRTELLNKEVTRTRIQEIKSVLQQTQPNDAVVLYLSGHGLIDKELDYFLATYDVDFSQPRNKGIPYEELENLLDQIPARKKLILMDACHSGEIDKSSVELIKTQRTTDGEVQFRSYNQTVANKQLGIANSFEMMKELFVDLRRSTGASVISSASGVEFALEGEKWKNGVFTYAMLKGLQEMKADTNGDGMVMVSELQQYLATEVPRLTDGQQQPTFRMENISNDWRIW